MQGLDLFTEQTFYDIFMCLGTAAIFSPNILQKFFCQNSIALKLVNLSPYHSKGMSHTFDAAINFYEFFRLALTYSTWNFDFISDASRQFPKYILSMKITQVCISGHM